MIDEPAGSVLLIQSWSQIVHDVKLNWIIYLSMPIVAAAVGYVTKIVAIQMLYKPLKFWGLGPIGWQGVVPRRAGKTASTTIELLTENLLKPEEILDRINAQEAVEEMRGPLQYTVDAMARELIDYLRPGLWDSMPASGRRAVQERVRATAPLVVERIIARMRADLTRFVDLQYLAVQILVRNKAQLNQLMKGLGGAPIQFIRRSGIYFGLAIGTVQMFAWGYLHNVWVMPVFGFFTGFASDWLALNLIFIPRHERKLFGLIPIRGVLHTERDQVTRDYARIMANDIFAVDAMMEAILNGPTSDHLFAVIGQEVSDTLDRELGVSRSLVTLAVGTQRYQRMKDKVVTTTIARLPETMEEAKDYAQRTLAIEDLIVEKMNQLTPEQYEGIMRPVFKDDELLMICVGAVLGFVVGELQVVFVEHFTR